MLDPFHTCIHTSFSALCPFFSLQKAIIQHTHKLCISPLYLLHSSIFLPRPPTAALPNCVLSKEMLVDGLKILISKEDELLYAACVQTLDLPDM